MTKQIIVNIASQGDESVGCHGYSLKLSIDGMSMKDDIETCIGIDGREEFRKDLNKFFNDWLDEWHLSIWFDDECPDCFKVNCDGKCCEVSK